MSTTVSPMPRFLTLPLLGAIFMLTHSARAEDAQLTLRLYRPSALQEYHRVTEPATWQMESTAVIVCDVWDQHHCYNAVQRLNEFTPRLNQFLAEARRRGATIIHAPSDCMETYAEHPARKRAIDAPSVQQPPAGIADWCSRIPQEEEAIYPIDQSDGGEDDEPQQHAAWAAQLKSLGRNPGMPWKSQSPDIEIDGEREYISDRGDEVWNILAARGIQHVILTGVHANMCVLGRPFGLRQMVRNGKDVIFLRDLSDSMYNPARWPYTDHFTGHDLVVAHIERYVCPTITSDQLLGGQPFRSAFDKRDEFDVAAVEAKQPPEWTLVDVPHAAPDAEVAWYRCAVYLPNTWKQEESLTLESPQWPQVQAWLNGTPADAADHGTLRFPSSSIVANEANFLVVRVERSNDSSVRSDQAPALRSGNRAVQLNGRWQTRIGDDPTWKNIPLPAKFGAPTDIVFEARAGIP